MNVKLLRKIQKHILAEPKRYNQNSWLLTGDAVIGIYGDEAPACKTVGCIAGWACALSPADRNKNLHVATDAEKLLGLTHDEANRLFAAAAFDPAGWPHKFVKQYKNAKTKRGRAGAAVRRIDHFIATHGAE